MASFGVVYSERRYKHNPFQSCKKKPYQDWVDRYSQPNVICKHEDYLPDCSGILRYAFSPSDQLMFFAVAAGKEKKTTWFQGTATITILHATKKLYIKEIWCNYILDDHRENMRHTKSGHILQEIDQQHKYGIMANFVAIMFGAGWEVIEPPHEILANPAIFKQGERLYIKAAEAANTSAKTYGIFEKYDIEKIQKAAPIIQKHFRGWKTRMEHTFNPYSAYGKHIALKEFHKLTSSTI